MFGLRKRKRCCETREMGCGRLFDDLRLFDLPYEGSIVEWNGEV